MPTPPTADRKSTLWRWSKRLGVAVLCVFALHAILINVFLSTSLWEKATGGDPDTILITFERGWSIWPGRVHARNLSIRSSDSNVQFLLRVERCDFTFSPYDLIAHKFFHVTDIQGSGVTFHAKSRVPAPSATPDYVSSLPVIPGFETIPLPKLGERDILERWDDRYWKLFTVQLENVTAENVTDVWIDAMRWQGHGTVKGGFYLKPIRLVHLDDIRTTIDAGQITIDQRVVADPMRGTFAIDMPPFDPRESSITDKYDAIRLSLDMSGRTPDLANLPRGMFAPLSLTGPVEWRQLRFELKDGKVAPGTHVDAALPAAHVKLDDEEATGAISLLADVRDGLTFEAKLRDASAMRGGTTIATLPSLEIDGDAHALDLRTFFEDFHAVGKLPDVVVPDLHALTAKAHGAAHAHGELEMWWSQRRARGQGALSAQGGFDRARGDVVFDGSFASLYWEQKALEDVKASLRVGHGALGEIAEVNELTAHVDASEIDLALAELRGTAQADAARVAVKKNGVVLSSALHAEAAIPDLRWEKREASVQDAKIVLTNASLPGITVQRVALEARAPRLRFDDPAADFQAKVSLVGGVLRDAEALSALLPADADLHPTARDGRLALEAEGAVENHVGRGKISLHGKRVGARGKKVSLLGDVTVALDIADVRADEGTMRVSRSNVALTDVVVDMGETPNAATAKRVELAVSADRVEVKHPMLAGVDYHLVASGAAMPDVRPLGDLLTSDPLKFGIDGGAAKVDIDLTSHPQAQEASGHALVVVENAAAHLKETKLTGNFQVDLQVKGYDPELDAVNITGSSVSMRNITTEGASAKASSWDGDVQVVGGALRVTQTPVFDGLLQLKADDASPILALVVQNHLPKFLVGLAKADALSGQARMTVEPGRVAILGAHIAGGDVELRGNYVAADKHVRGAVKVAKGPLSAGLASMDGKTQVRLFALDSWMKEETSAAMSLYRDPRVSAKAPPRSAP